MIAAGTHIGAGRLNAGLVDAVAADLIVVEADRCVWKGCEIVGGPVRGGRNGPRWS